MRILVTGGAGYIGSHAVRRLLNEGHDVTVLDNLSHGHEWAIAAAAEGTGRQPRWIKGSTADRALVEKILRDQAIEGVMHFAAFIEVGESVQDPAKYYHNNFSAALSLMDAMVAVGVRRLVFSSTAAVYGNPASTPITEDQARLPINPYGRSKMMVELAIEDYAAAYGLGYAILRYFNVAGASPDGGIGEAHEPESHLIPRILSAAGGQESSIGIFGTDYDTRDGTCIRDYIHVDDLVAAHVLAMEKIQPGMGKAYNLGSERGFSVREVIAACERVTGMSLKVEEKPRRPGDPAILVASSSRIRSELGWERRYPDLETIVSHAWKWHHERMQLFRESA